MRKGKIALQFLLTTTFVCCLSTTNGQDTTARETIGQYASRYTLLGLQKAFDSERMSMFSYIVLYDEKSEVDTIFLSSLPSFLMEDKSKIIEELEKGFTALSSEGLDLADVAIFVPVRIIPNYAHYDIDFREIGDTLMKEIINEWAGAFPVIDTQVVGEVKLKYIIPVYCIIGQTMRKE